MSYLKFVICVLNDPMVETAVAMLFTAD